MNNKKIKKFIKNDIKKVKNEPMSNITIKDYLPNSKIIEYKQLNNYKNLNELLPNNKDYVIILFRHDYGNHWICLLKLNDIYEFFCSYGSYPDSFYNEWTTKKANIKYGQNEPYLTKLINNTKNTIIYNPVKYQNDNNDIASCGRHILNRIYHMLNHNTNLNEYYEFMKRKHKEHNLSYDDLVSIVINKLNND